MNFKHDTAGGKLQQVVVDSIDTGWMDQEESVEFAIKLISLADGILYRCHGFRYESDKCTNLVGDIREKLAL